MGGDLRLGRLTICTWVKPNDRFDRMPQLPRRTAVRQLPALCFISALYKPHFLTEALSVALTDPPKA